MTHKFRKKVILVVNALLIVLISHSLVLSQTLPSSEEIKQTLMSSGEKEMLEKGIKTMGVSTTPRHHNPEIHLQIPFDLNQYQISPRAIPYVQALGDALSSKELKGFIFEIQGHTCSLGTDSINDLLSQKRAESVREYLISYFNLSPSQLKATGYGKKMPLYDNTTDEGRVKNRRVTIVNTLKPFEETSKRPFVETKVEYLRGDKVSTLQPGETLTARDNYELTFIPHQRSYVYIFQVSHGEAAALFPNSNFSKASNPVTAGSLYRIPENIYDWLHLDENKGEEEIILIASLEALEEPQGVCMKIHNSSESMKFASGASAAEYEKTMGVKGIRQADINIRTQSTDTLETLFTWRLRFAHQ